MIGLIDVDGKLPNLALMKISAFYKSVGEQIEFVDMANIKKYSKVYASCLFTWNKPECHKLQRIFGDVIEFGGTGWDFEMQNGELVEVNHSVLSKKIEACSPDYELYTTEMIYQKACMGGIAKKESKLMKAEIIANMGIGFTSRGCVRKCKFCVVPKKEGCFKNTGEIKDLINPKSNIITLYDNNFTADPDCVEKLNEIRDRKLKVNISQGIDVRLLDDEKAFALSQVKHLRSLHYAWDLLINEKSILEGIKLLSKYVKSYRHMCYILSGYNTTFEEDMHRATKLIELGVTPYVMKYNSRKDNTRLNHFAGWINSHKYTKCTFEEFEPWVKAKAKENIQMSLF